MKCRPLSHEKAAAGAGATPTSGSSTRMRTGPPAPTWVTVWGPGATANGSSSWADDGSLRKQLACVPGTAARRSHVLHHIYATRYLARTCVPYTVLLLTGQQYAFLRPTCALARLLAPSLVILDVAADELHERGERAFARTPIALEFDRDPP